MTTTDCQIENRLSLKILFGGLVFPSIFTWVYFVLLADHPSHVQQIVYAAGKFLQFSLPVTWFLAKHGRLLMPRRSKGGGLWISVVSGVAIFGVMLAGYYLWAKPMGLLDGAASPIRAKVQGFGVRGPWGFLLMGAFYSVIHSFLEEYYWRWFVVGGLRAYLRPWPAILLGSTAFMAHHVIVLGYYLGPWNWMTWAFSLAVAFAGAVWGWTYLKTESLLGPWLSHFLADAAIFWIAWQLVRV